MMLNTFSQVFPKCEPEGMETTVENLMYVFDDTQVGTIAFRELLIMFCVSMNSQIEEKLNWTFR